jgi:hypothetical protein
MKEEIEEILNDLEERIKERLNSMESRLQLLEIIAKNTGTQSETEKKATKKVIQINAGDKKYFCATEQERQAFSQNNPNTKTESFEVELSIPVADEYLNDPENKKAFQGKDNK